MINDTDGRKLSFCSTTGDVGNEGEYDTPFKGILLKATEIAAINSRHETELVAARGEGAEVESERNWQMFYDLLVSSAEDAEGSQPGGAEAAQHGKAYRNLAAELELIPRLTPYTATTYTETIRAEERAKVLEEAAQVADKMAWCGYAVDIARGIRSLAQDKE